MLTDVSLAAAFMIGFLGSTHCVGMCGGIVGALTMGLPESTRRSPLKLLPYLVTYNSGRLISYSIAGLIVGLVSGTAGEIFQIGEFPAGGIVGGLFMIALGIYIAGWFQTLAWLEKAGNTLWIKIKPLGQRFMPIKSPAQALGLGLFWGWLPCGLVYSTLAWSATSGDAVYSAMLMLSFGAGTLPMLLLMGSFADRLQRFTRNKWTRYVAGILLILFGVMILSKALGGGHMRHGHMGNHVHTTNQEVSILVQGV